MLQKLHATRFMQLVALCKQAFSLSCTTVPMTIVFKMSLLVQEDWRPLVNPYTLGQWLGHDQGLVTVQLILTTLYNDLLVANNGDSQYITVV
jgi:hypothetical protein